jgi:23S rRNA pseudouridine1911/1915/1917 synthase
MAQQEHHQLTVEEPEHGRRIDRALAARLSDLSRSRIKALILEGRLRVDGKLSKDPALRVQKGQLLLLEVPAAVSPTIAGQAIPLDIRYEDSDLIVVDKPAGLVVHPAPGNPDHTLVNALVAHCGESLTGIGGTLRPGIVHRLDKDTSGLMVAAKTDHAHQRLVADFAARRIERSYQALVWGKPEPAVGRIVGAIGRNPRNRKKMAVVKRGGKSAETQYRVLASYGHGLASLVECRLKSGRTHQIRVHLSHLGHPIMGDKSYGRQRKLRDEGVGKVAEAIKALDRQALHAVTLGFSHPTTGEKLTFKSELPRDIEDLKSSLESL